MKMLTILTSAALFSTTLSIGCAFADDIFIKNISLGSHSLTPQDLASTVVPFYMQTEQFKSECIDACKQVKTSWIPLVSVLNATKINEGYLFSSGVDGIAVLLKPNTTNTEMQQLEISLIKTKDGADSGELSSIPLLRRTTEQINEDGLVINRISEDISVSGIVNRSGCIIPQGQSLNMTLSPISASLLRNTMPGSLITSISTDSFLNVQCESNTSGALDLLFTAYDTPPTKSTVLFGLTETGKQSGVGFIVKAGDKEIEWDGKTPITVPLSVDSTSFTIPFRAYYTRTTGGINPGNISARGMMTVKYH
ncbi:fimbrial protein [Yersinia enterocolitica]|uniref:fimbrial protein n=1 Tax=Yersinia enterocolitica TaxID=630 RepID=UPI003AB7D71F